MFGTAVSRRHGVVDGGQVDFGFAVVVAAPAVLVVRLPVLRAVVRRGRVIVHVAVAVPLLLQRQPQWLFGRHRGAPGRLFRVVVERPAARGRRQVRIVLGALVPVLRVRRVLLLQVQRPDAAAAAVVLLQVRGAAAERRLRVQEPEQRLLGLAYVPRPVAVPAGRVPVVVVVVDVPFAGRRRHAVMQIVVRLGRDHGAVRGRHQRLDGRGTAVQPRHRPDARLDRRGWFRSAAVVVHHLLALVLLYGRHAVLGTLAAHHRRVGAPLEQLHVIGRGRPALDQLGYLVLQVRHPVRQPHVFRLVRVPRPVRVLGPRPARVQLPPDRGQLQLIGRRTVVHDDHAHRRRRHLQQTVQVVLVLHRQHHLAVHLQQPENVIILFYRYATLGHRRT